MLFTNNSLVSRTLFAASFLFLVGSSGCVAEQADDGSDQEIMSDDLGAEPMAWTGVTSDEYLPVMCVSGRLVGGVECSGSYCDNVRIDCLPPLQSGLTFGSSSWTGWFSEEGTNYRTCGATQWMTGFQCDDDYCDNVSIQCTEVPGASAQGCSWSAYYSEENGAYHALPGRFVRGVRCRGSFCDQMSYLTCTLAVP